MLRRSPKPSTSLCHSCLAFEPEGFRSSFNCFSASASSGLTVWVLQRGSVLCKAPLMARVSEIGLASGGLLSLGLEQDNLNPRASSKITLTREPKRHGAIRCKTAWRLERAPVVREKTAMSKIVIAVAVGAIAAFSLAPQPAQARHCSMVTATAPGVTQGIATRKADRRLRRYATHNLSGWGVRAGPRHTCQAWGVGQSLRPSCQSSAIVCR